jgi:hypothetical protein
MRYLTLEADYNDICIKNNYNTGMEIKTLKLPESYLIEVYNWNNKYKEIAFFTSYDLSKDLDKINKLDEEGFQLAEKLFVLLNKLDKIEYYSEILGTRRFIVQ